jgi:hypothetical protein
MHNPIIVNSTGFPPADLIIGDMVRAFEEVFPGRVRGYYLSGSYAEGAPAGILSDIDLCIMFIGDFYAESEGDAARRLARQCAASRSIRLDAFGTCETELPKLEPAFQVTLKTGTVLTYVDIRGRDRLPHGYLYSECHRGRCISSVAFCA